MSKMEDVLEVYEHPFDLLRPVVCIDETNKQLIKEKRIPFEPGHASDTLYPRAGAEKIVIVTDNLNTHFPAYQYRAFAPEEARHLAERFEWHYAKTRELASMSEIEIGIMSC